jgi:hypothetical protein
LKDYPTAPAACRNVTVKDGVKYATFNGKVAKVGHDYVQVEVKDLKVGDHLTFWVREGRFGISPTLTDQPMSIVKPEAMSTH